MAVTSVTNISAYRSVIASSKPTIVDFWAAWCGPCKAIRPQFDKLAEKHPNIQCLSVNVDDAGDIASEVGVTALPTFVFYANGELTGKVVGADLNSLNNAFVDLSKRV